MPLTALSGSLPAEFPRIDLHRAGGNSSQFKYSELTPLTSPLNTRVILHKARGNSSHSRRHVNFPPASLSSLNPCSRSSGYHFITQEATKPQKYIDARQQIKQLKQTAGEDNWDGEGSIKVSSETIEIALKLVAAFPNTVLSEELDIDATPFGSIDFGWVLDRDVMMNIIVLSTGEIGFAYSVHGERDDGKEHWKGTIPGSISDAFDKVFDRDGFYG